MPVDFAAMQDTYMLCMEMRRLSTSVVGYADLGKKMTEVADRLAKRVFPYTPIPEAAQKVFDDVCAYRLTIHDEEAHDVQKALEWLRKMAG